MALTSFVASTKSSASLRSLSLFMLRSLHMPHPHSTLCGAVEVRYDAGMPEKLAAFTIRLSRREQEALRRLAAANDMYVAAYVRRIIQRHVAAKSKREGA